MTTQRGGCRPLQPTRPTPRRHRRQAMPPAGFGLLPVRSPLLRESSLFLGVLRCFSSPGALFGIAPQVPGRAPGGLPHSDIPGSQAASASPGHFAAWPRPSSAANAKASTMRPSCGDPHPAPVHRARRCSAHRAEPARASRDVAAPLTRTWLRTVARHNARSRPDPARRLLSARCAGDPSPLARPPRFRVARCCRLAASCRGLYVCVIYVQCARATRPEPAFTALGVALTPGRARPSWALLAPTAAEPVGFRVAPCQGTGAGFLPPVTGLPRLEVVRPRAKPSPDLARTLPTSPIPAGTPPGDCLPHSRWSRGDSNPGPPPCKGGALPAKLRPPAPRDAARWGGRAWTRTRDLGLIRAAL
jgi:hypothetical protein